jgi:hypothetical protein
MSQDQWTQADRYITDLLVPPDPALDAALQAATDAGLPPAHVAPNQGKLSTLTATTQAFRACGFSTPCWLPSRA